MVNYRNDPESQQPLQSVNHQYGSASINNSSASNANQQHSHHNIRKNTGVHFAQIALQLLHILTTFLLAFAGSITEYVSDCAWFLSLFSVMFFWAYGGLGLIVHIVEVISRCRHPAPRDYYSTKAPLVWHYIKLFSHLIVAIVFTVWTIAAGPEWFDVEVPRRNRWVVLVAALQAFWAAISTILELVLICRARAYRKHLLEEAFAAQRELPTSYNINPYGQY